MSLTKIVVDCATGETYEVEMHGTELGAHTATLNAASHPHPPTKREKLLQRLEGLAPSDDTNKVILQTLRDILEP